MSHVSDLIDALDPRDAAVFNAALASRDAEIERLKAEAEALKARWEIDNKIELELRALVEQLAGALELMKISKHEHHAAFYAMERALAAAAAYRKERG